MIAPTTDAGTNIRSGVSGAPRLPNPNGLRILLIYGLGKSLLVPWSRPMIAISIVTVWQKGTS